MLCTKNIGGRRKVVVVYCVYIPIYSYMHTSMNTYIHTYKCINVYKYVYIYTGAMHKKLGGRRKVVVYYEVQ